MKNNHIMQGTIFLVCFFLSFVTSMQAQYSVQDSLHKPLPLNCTSDDGMYRLKLGEVLIPVTLVGMSTLYVQKKWTRHKNNIQRSISAEGTDKFKLDDYIQYSPAAAVYGLNLLGIKGKHSLKDRTIILAMSYVTMGIIVNTMKYSIRERRPDSDVYNSFPSGHTATAFMGAEFLYREYKDVSPWIGYAGYSVAALTGYLRIYNDRHYFNDVIAGACIGILSTKLAYWLYPKFFKPKKENSQVSVMGLPYYSKKEFGMNVCIFF